MKCVWAFVYIASFVIVSVQADWLSDVIHYSELCETQFPTAKENIEKMFKGELKAINADDTLTCFVKCIMEKQGTFVRGTFSMPGLMKITELDKSLKEIQAPILQKGEACRYEKGENDCETAFKIALCMSEKIADIA
uniref:Uncharacterized protein n=1 Tax=Stomoxys calcitrans TaxID=35570 RepID=A0A1I8P5Z4_STOCA